MSGQVKSRQYPHMGAQVGTTKSSSKASALDGSMKKPPPNEDNSDSSKPFSTTWIDKQAIFLMTCQSHVGGYATTHVEFCMIRCDVRLNYDRDNDTPRRAIV